MSTVQTLGEQQSNRGNREINVIQSTDFEVMHKNNILHTIAECDTLKEVGDTKLKQAIEKCVTEGSNLPILKQELWCKIQYRRLISGQGELFIDKESNKTSIKFQLTEEDVRKRNRRRLQNRASASRCKHRQKQYEAELEHKVQEMESHGEELRTLIETLEKEKQVLLSLIQNHSESCNNTNGKIKSRKYVSLLKHQELVC